MPFFIAKRPPVCFFSSGAASMAWHGDPALLRRDGYSGDYGIGLYGFWRSAGSYLSCLGVHGWVCVLCDVSDSSSSPPLSCDHAGPVRVVPREPFGRKMYLASLGLSFTVEGASIALAEFWPRHPRVTLHLKPYAAAPSHEATLFIEAESVEPPPRHRPTDFQVPLHAHLSTTAHLHGHV